MLSVGLRGLWKSPLYGSTGTSDSGQRCDSLRERHVLRMNKQHSREQMAEHKLQEAKCKRQQKTQAKNMASSSARAEKHPGLSEVKLEHSLLLFFFLFKSSELAAIFVWAT